ncbi:MAG: hypothetical protein ACRC00_11970 [Exiguobacterium acetylicum]
MEDLKYTIQLTAREWMRIEPYKRERIKKAFLERTNENTVSYFDKIEELTENVYENIYGKEA